MPRLMTLSTLQYDINLHSRIHPLFEFCHKKANVFIKRDDELSSGISGSKWRKYASIMPALRQKNITHVYVIGSAHSNNVLAAMQCLREHGLSITALLLRPNHSLLKGNFKLSHLFLDEKDIIWLERSDWPNAENIAQGLSESNPKKCFVLNEGASVIEGIDGAKTLGLDILRNEQEHQLKFDHVFMDAGTGFSASCCIKQLEEKKHKARCYVLLLADPEALFKEKSNRWAAPTLINTHCFIPSNAKSFGSINQTVKHFIRSFAKNHGVLLDPIYSAKCFFEAQKVINNQNITGNILIIHSGGLLTLPNFEL